VLPPARAQADDDGTVQVEFTLDGEPLSDAWVALFQDDEFIDGLSFDWDTGYFQASVPPGVYDLEFYDYTPGVGSRTIRDVEVRAGEITELSFELGPMLSVQVKVMSDGAPFPNATVLIHDSEGGEVAYLEWDEESGAYVGEVTPYTWTLLVYPDTDVVETKCVTDFIVSADAQNVFTVELLPLRLLQIRLLAGTEPTPSASVTIMLDGEIVDYGSYNEETGLFEAWVPEGTYEVEIEPYHLGLYEEQIVVASTGEITTVQLGGQIELHLNVLSPYGTPYPFARVTIADDDDYKYAYWSPEEQTYKVTLVEGVYDITVRPDDFYSSQTLEGVAIEGDVVELTVELAKPATYTQSDLSRVISKEELLALAKRYQENNLALLDATAKRNVEEQLDRLAQAKGAARDKLVQEFTGASIMLGASAMEKELSLIFGATAVLAEPDDALILNNFGAVLVLAGSLSDAVQVLNYGRSISPESPLILTNLANALLDMGDDTQAGELLLEALRHEPEFSEAHTALATVYMARGDAQKALDHIVMAAANNFTPAMRQAAQQARSAGAKSPPPRSSTGQGPAESSDGGVPDVQSQLVIPRLPNWSSRDALNASAERLARWMSDVLSHGLTEPLNAAWELYQTKAAPPGMAKAYNGPYSQLVFEIECYGQYLQDRLEEIFDQYTATFDTITEAWSEQVVRITDQQVYEWDAALRDMEEATGLRSLAVARQSLLRMDEADQAAGRQRRDATDVYFVIWRDLFRSTYEEVARLVEEYWIYTESPASRIYDPDTAEFVHQLRTLQVYASFAPLAIQLPFQMMMMDIGGFGSMMRPLGEPLKPETPGSMDTIQVPEAKKDSCPLRDGRSFNPDAGLVSVKVTCETVEVKVGAIIKGSVTWNFKHKYVSSVYLGAATPGKGLIQLGAEGGLRANFGPNGEVLGLKPEGGFGGNIGGEWIGGMLSGSVGTGDGLVVNRGGLSTRLR
jgi:Tfp pilus assembly protein PilF